MGCGSLVAVLVACLCVLAPFVYDVLIVFDAFKTMPRIPSGRAASCEIINRSGRQGVKEAGAPFTTSGFEDVSYIDTATAVACGGDLHDVFTRGPEAVPTPSACVLIELEEGNVSPLFTELKFVNFPEGDFRKLHGLSVVKGAGGEVKIFAVNHAFYAGGERIDVFTLDRKAYTLTYEGSVRHPSFDNDFNGVLNDIAVVNNDEFYVTAFFPSPDPRRGRPHPETLYEHTRVLRVYLALLFKQLDTKLIHCQYKVHTNADYHEGTTCRVVQRGYMMANGVTSIPAPRKGLPTIVIVNDVLNKTLHSFAVEPAPSGPPRMVQIGAHKLYHSADNVELDPATVVYHPSTGAVTASLYLGSIVNIGEAAKIDHAPRTVSPGAATRVDVQVTYGVNARLDVTNEKDLVVDDGTEFRAVASSVWLRRPDATSEAAGKVLLGSYKEPGIMVC